MYHILSESNGFVEDMTKTFWCVFFGSQYIGMISQERLKIEVKLLLSTNRKSYMPRRLAQQRMTLSDLEWYRTLPLW